MEHQPALYALIRLHADLGHQIKANAKEAKRLRDGMKHVEAVLKMLEPGIDTRRIAAKRKNAINPWFKRGTIFRAVLEVLRDAPAPMTAEEITVALFRSKGVQEPSREQRRHLWGGVARSLMNNRGRSVAETAGRPRRWSLAR